MKSWCISPDGLYGASNPSRQGLPVLSPSLAQEIAGDTSAVIGLNVLITDGDGIVIGSGDSSRIGSFHEASVEVMRTKEPAEHTAPQAQRLRGVRPGVTLPLVMDGRAVGTVGITGTPTQVRRFGLVVKRQTEILLRESVLMRSRVLRERVVEDLLADIAAYDAHLVEADFIAYRAAEAGFDLRLARVAVTVQVAAPRPEVSAPGRNRNRATRETALIRPELLRIVREVFADPQDIIASMIPGWIGVLHHLPQQRRLADGVPAVCRRMTEVIGSRHGLTARVGIGEPADSISGLRDSYQDACDALRLGARIARDTSVHLIADLRAHQVLASAGRHARAHLFGPTVRGLRAQPDWPVLRSTIVAWCENGFSLVGASAALHIHRNTLIYRMAKIEQVTGRPLRDHRTTLALYLACLADQLEDEET
jgi:carbohydrate diacid regulator